VIVNVRTN